jgi:hypothetical protein
MLIHPLRATPEPGAPYQCLSSVHVFGVNGLDPVCIGNFNGLCAYLKEQGCNTYFAQLWSISDMAGRIKALRACDPNAKIVLMGYSLGCNRIRALANELKKDNIQIDLLVYLGGDMILSHSRSCPPNVCRTLNVRAHGFCLTGGDLLTGTNLPCARNVKVNCRHLKIPSRPEVAHLVLGELLALSGGPTTAPAEAVVSEPIPK